MRPLFVPFVSFGIFYKMNETAAEKNVHCHFSSHPRGSDLLRVDNT